MDSNRIKLAQEAFRSVTDNASFKAYTNSIADFAANNATSLYAIHELVQKSMESINIEALRRQTNLATEVFNASKAVHENYREVAEMSIRAMKDVERMAHDIKSSRFTAMNRVFLMLAAQEAGRVANWTESYLSAIVPTPTAPPTPKAPSKTDTDLLFTELESFEPDMALMWKGSVEAYYDDNSDRKRHTSTSLRELIQHTLRRLAPNRFASIWYEANAHRVRGQAFNDKGRPTRALQIAYITRGYTPGEGLRNFASDSTDALSKAIKHTGAGVHKSKSLSSLQEDEIRSLIFRTGEACVFLIKCARKSGDLS